MNELIKINKKTAIKSEERSTSTFPYVFMFFLFGSLMALCGSSFFGVYLWLVINQKLFFTSTFYETKTYHIYIQFFYFIGIFIHGFLYQAGPKLFQVNLKSRKIPQISIYSHLLSFILLFINFITLSKLVLLFSYLILILTIINWSRQIILRRILTISIPLLVGLTCLSIGIFINLANPISGLLLFWFGIGPILFVTGQQFITGFLEGRWLRQNEYITCSILFIISIFSAIVFVEPTATYQQLVTSKIIFGVCGLIVTIIYFYKTGALIGIFKNITSTINVAFLSAFIWLIYGLIGITFDLLNYDQILHQWGIGVATVLILSISIRISGFIKSNKFFNEILLYFLIILLQVVIVLRTTRITVFESQTIILSSLNLLIFSTWFVILVIRMFPSSFNKIKHSI